MKKYEYLVAYIHQNGYGRVFITRNAPIGSSDDIVSIETVIAESNDATSVGISNFQLLRTYEDEN